MTDSVIKLRDLVTRDKSFNDIKTIFGHLDLFNINEEELMVALDTLNRDARKNVNSLGDRIKKRYEKIQMEKHRVRNMYSFDRSYLTQGFLAGVDEVGRGPLAGPIVGAAVILNLEDKEDIIWEINDSKALSHEKREELAKIIEKKALSINISIYSNNDIDKKGISYCNNQVLKEASENLKVKPSIILSDGYAIRGSNIHNEFVIKGDSKSASIACASIIAKVYRDNLMKVFGDEFPQYDFENNVGYGTQKHVEAIKTYGITKIHRKSFLKSILD